MKEYENPMQPDWQFAKETLTKGPVGFLVGVVVIGFMMVVGVAFMCLLAIIISS